MDIKHSLFWPYFFFQDERQQSIDLNVWVIEKWDDEFLGWDPYEYGLINSTVLPYEAIWLPDTYIYNRYLSTVLSVCSLSEVCTSYVSFKRIQRVILSPHSSTKI
ncbi:unnamed protein product [Toxocara canis]|uniref:Neur_chan_LBD domain-containing protein n=1 Tax=Toxocara canis TaxID=6265 RepID=A0A183U587_TOXCA|nr:unnamed protein product [Toxocara canis]